MRYDSIFKDKTKQELQEVLTNCDNLSWNAKIDLLTTIEAHDLDDNDQTKLERLREDLETIQKDVESLKYLSNMGFQAIEEPDGLRIVRVKAAKKADIFGLILGILLMLLIGSTFELWKSLFTIELSASGLFFALLLSGLVILGFMLFVRCCLRLIRYKNFEILSNDNGVILTYRSNSKFEKKRILRQDFIVQSKGSNSYLMLNGEEKAIIMSSGGEIGRRTINHLLSKLFSDGENY